MNPARWFPFLAWFPMRRETLTADLVAGFTVAMVLVPQALAYAQLAGVPAYHGLYAAFLPAIVGALWGSSRHLATGPVAVTSLLTASVLLPLASAGSQEFVMLAVVLALLAGIVRLALGVFRLGVIVNFLSYPVLLGFTNGAAIIIAVSQVPRLLGLTIGRNELFARDVWAVVDQLGNTHVPTLAMGAGALVIIGALRRFWPRVPGVLVAVVVATLVSWAIGFEHSGHARLDDLADDAVRTLARDYANTDRLVADDRPAMGERAAELRASARAHPGGSPEDPGHPLPGRDARPGAEGRGQGESRARARPAQVHLRARRGAPDAAGPLYLAGQLPAGVASDGRRWRIGTLVGDTARPGGRW